MFVKILVGIGALGAVLVAVVATRPSSYRVERRLEIAAPKELVFGVLNDLHGFVGVWVLFGSSWDELESNTQATFHGPATGAGQSFAWKGEDSAGRLTLDHSIPGESVRLTLEFSAPMESIANCEIALAGTPNGTVVTWSMAGTHNFLGKALGLFTDLDHLLGADIEKSLARLRVSAEGQQAAANAR